MCMLMCSQERLQVLMCSSSPPCWQEPPGLGPAWLTEPTLCCLSDSPFALSSSSGSFPGRAILITLLTTRKQSWYLITEESVSPATVAERITRRSCPLHFCCSYSFWPLCNLRNLWKCRRYDSSLGGICFKKCIFSLLRLLEFQKAPLP